MTTKIEILVAPDHMGDMDGLDVSASMARYAEQVEAELRRMNPGTDIIVKWGDCDSGGYRWKIPADMSLEERDRWRDEIERAVNEIFDASDWAVEAG